MESSSFLTVSHTVQLSLISSQCVPPQGFHGTMALEPEKLCEHFLTGQTTVDVSAKGELNSRGTPLLEREAGECVCVCVFLW